jgi:hypothetical protein
MKATLTFELPDEREEHSDAVNGTAWKAVAWHLDNLLRGWIKYGHEFKTPDDALQAARDALNDCVNDEDLTLD